MYTQTLFMNDKNKITFQFFIVLARRNSARVAVNIIAKGPSCGNRSTPSTFQVYIGDPTLASQAGKGKERTYLQKEKYYFCSSIKFFPTFIHTRLSMNSDARFSPRYTPFAIISASFNSKD